MPPARKSCQRCRDHKARCIWTADALDCTRCRRSNYPCRRPTNEDSGMSAQKSVKEATAPQSCDVDDGEQSRADLANIIQSELGPESGAKISLDTNMLLWTPQSRSPPIVFTSKNTYTTEEMPLFVASCQNTNCYLPPPEEAQMLLTEFLHDFNSRVPIYSPDALLKLFQGCYSGENNNKPLAWVLVYTTLALTLRLRAMSVFAATTDTPQAEYYLNKALSKLPELLMGPPSLKLVQALISLTFLLQTSNKCHRAPLFASRAVHMAEDLGYNELVPASETEGTPKNEQYYVFWVCFALDAHMSIASQRPTTTSLANINTPLPPDNIVDWWNPQPSSNPCEWNVNIFAQHCSLAVIEAEATEELFSAKARRQSPEVTAQNYANIMEKLTSWRAQSALSKLEAQDVLRAMYRSDIVHCIMLESSYFRTVYQCYATNKLVHFTSKVDVFTPETLQAAFELQDPTCYDDARRLLNLLDLMPQGNLSTTWASIQAIVAAACTVLSAHSLRYQDIQHARVKDVELCHHVLCALETASEQGIDPALGAAIGQCREVYLLSATA